jgi:hypothetical protein
LPQIFLLLFVGQDMNTHLPGLQAYWIEMLRDDMATKQKQSTKQQVEISSAFRQNFASN